MTLPPRLAARIPAGTCHEIPDRGRVVVWDTGCPDLGRGEPPLVLLHGWNVDAGLNFANALDHLRDRCRVVMFDLRGHGRGFRSGPFTLERCADDTIAILDAIGIGSFVPVGYSMGGAVAQLLARRTDGRAAGLVVAASAANFAGTGRERAEGALLRLGASALGVLPEPAQHSVFERLATAACRPYPDWVRDVVLTADPVNLLQAGAAMRGFDSRGWLHSLDLPTAVVITERDRIVAPPRQWALATAINGATALPVASNHDLPIRHRARYGAVLRQAVDKVLA